MFKNYLKFAVRNLMKTKLFMFVLFFVICTTYCSSIHNSLNDEQRYGQKTPGTTPELYQPKFSFIEGAKPEVVVFSPDGSELCFPAKDTSTNKRIIYYMKKDRGNWTKPEVAYFIPNNGMGGLLHFSPDGSRFYYMYKGDFWSSVKKSSLWIMAEKLHEPVCTDKYECGFSLVQSDMFYFAANGRPEGKGSQCDIYCSKMTDGTFGPILNLSSLNTKRSECTLGVSPDEKYIIFTRFFLKDGHNATDLFISFRRQDGTWTLAQKLGPLINSTGSNSSPRFSYDGKYFFFNQAIRNEAGAYNIKKYWVSTGFFDEMRESVLNVVKNN